MGIKIALKAFAQDVKVSILAPLYVLMWKHARERQHRYIYTFWEIFGGLLVFVVLFLVNQTIRPIQEKSHANDTDDDEITRVYYTPHDHFTRRLMAKVAYNLVNNTETDLMPELNWEFVKDGKIPKLFNKSDSVAVVKFKNNGSFQQDLVYTIKVKAKKEPDNLYHWYNGFFRGVIEEEEPTPQFLPSLQWAIDKSFMEELSDQEIAQALQLRIRPKFISRELRALQKFMIICTILAPLPFFLINASRWIDERRTGLRELMKLAGVTGNVRRFSRLLDAAFIGTLYVVPATLLLTASSRPILPYSSPLVVGVTLLLHYLSTTTLAFVTTTFSQDHNYADSLGLFFYVSAFFLDWMWYSHETESNIAIYIICTILPHAPIYMFWDEVLYLEQIGRGIHFYNLEIQHSNTCLTVLNVWIFFFIQICLYFTLAWYLDLVRPGRHGVSKKWNFFCKKSYWKHVKHRKLNISKTNEKSEARDKRDQKYFERGPKKAEIAVRIVNVTKIFKAFKGSQLKALDRVRFDCYKGEITVVLGVNGAGKTTLMSIITGMYSPTKGAVFINGKDVVNKFREVREGIGFCSQYNLSFPYLTIKENIKFFHMLKTTQHDDDLTLEQLLKKLKLKDKANLFTSDLSSGMLRCLQVACSLASGAEVLVLDEPTSGMDVEIRHRLWDLFMVLRGNKTIIMTTGCLEEATALGDRIVILNNGILRCHGTPMFLKHALGVSCNLSVTLTDSSHMMYLIDIVEDLIPDVRHRIEDIKRVTFSLPSKEHDKFPEMFKALEKNKAVLGIVLIDVGMFMEEVFLEFVDEEDDEEYDMEMNLSCRHMKMDQISGFRLTITRIKLLISRIYEYMLLRKYQCLIWQVIVPIVGFFLITLTTNDCLGYGKMFSHHEFYHPEIKAVVYNEGPFRRSGINESLHKFPKLNAVHSKDIDKDFSDRKTYKSHKSIGIKMMEHYTRVFHPHEPYLVSKSINIHSNIYMSVHMPYLNQSIITKYEPIRKKGKAPIDPKSVFLCLKWSIWVVFLSIMPLAPFITLSIKEHYEGTRDNHMMAGCSPMIHWGSKFIAHMAGYLLIIPAPLIVLTVALDLDKTFNQPRFIGAFAMILLAFGPAFLAHIYFLSFIFQVKYAICQVYIMSMVLGTIFPIAVAVLEPVWKAHTVLTITYLTLTIVARISPLFAYTDGLARVTLQARSNAFCRLNKHMCPNLTSRELSFYPEICCNSPSTMPFRYMEDYVTGLHDFLTLIIQFFIYSVLVILLEHRIPQYIIERIMTCQYRVPRHKFFSVSVSKEADYVRSKLRAGQTKHDVILAHNLHKTFKNIFNKKHKCEPIKGISFSGKMGECIGFVGPQDVGKSTLLMMLTGLLVMTRGNCVVKGQHIRKNRSKYVRNICFASQSFGMDTFRTGVQNLTFLAMLQGYSKEMAIRISLLSLHFMGLHANASMVKQYSAGCVRRLGLCAALVLAPALAVLDEPMLDVDHNSRSRVAKALQRLVLEPAVVIVAEASVDWGHMESVYSRMAILSQGELAALGPAGDIHARVANGYTARIKLKVYSAYREDREKALDDDDDSSSSSESDAAMHSEKSVMHAQGIVAFKRDFMRIFPESSILGEHLCMLYFHIEDPENTLTYSEMFARLEKLRAKHDDTVEDYILSSTTIEDVFWRLKKEPFKRESITGPVEYV